ncbi:DUF7563 family protein [Halomontanus rarus]
MGEVTVSFQRVFGTNDNTVDGCPDCTSHSKLCDRNR